MKGREVFGEHRVVFELQEDNLIIKDEDDGTECVVKNSEFRGSETRSLLVTDKNGNQFPATRVTIYYAKDGFKAKTPDEMPRVNVFLID